MSRARGVRGARKMRAFAKDRVVGVSSEEAWEEALKRAGGRLVVAEFVAVRCCAVRRLRAAPVLTRRAALAATCCARSPGARRARRWRPTCRR
jgi:hypothetical protein